MSFLAPAALGALVLVAVPILIHLFNRRRFRTVDWAPMRYLLQAFRKHRRRLRLEEILLLLVRTAFVLFIVLALAHPIATRPGWPWKHLDARVARVLVIDDTLSMGWRSPAGMAFERGRRAALSLLEAWSPLDPLTILSASAPDRRRFATSPESGLDGARGAIEALPLTDAACSMGAVLAAAGRHLAAAAEPEREVVLVTDLRKAGWDPAVASAAESLAKIGARLRVVDCGEDSTEDLTVTALETTTPAVFPGQAIQMTAKVRNAGREAFGPASAQLRFGASERTVALPRIEAGAEALVTFAVSFDRPGAHAVSVTLPDDALPADGLRLAVVWVRERLDVVIVDGEPSVQPFESESDFVAAALGVGDLPVHVRVAHDSEWLSQPPESADLTILCNLASMPPAQAAHLEALVRRGMGLMIFPGDQVEPDAWNDRLDRGGAGILPAPLVAPRDAGLTGIVVGEAMPSPLDSLRRLAPGALSSIKVRKCLELSQRADSSMRVLARWAGPAGAPALVDRAAGAGRVVLWTTTADRAWSDWPIDPSWVLAVRETAFDAARRGPPGLEREAGPELAFRPDGRVTHPRLRVAGEDQDRAVEVREDPDGVTLRCGPAERAGIYGLAWIAENGAEISRTVAVNPAASEAALARWDRDGFRRFVSPLATDVATDAEIDASHRDASRELWRTLLIAAVALFLLESLLTAHLGREG